MILSGRVAIVTGAGSGIGRGSAEIMAREGAMVIVVDRDAAAAKDAAGSIKANGGSAEAAAIDVTDDGAVAALVKDTLQRFGRLDILHNHAGLQVEGTLEDVLIAGFDRSWDVNVRAHFIAARLVVPAMKAQGGGVILNTSSSSGVLIDREMIAYATTKHAVIAMTRQMALDYARFNIRVNALCPRLGGHAVQRALYPPDGWSRRRRCLCQRTRARGVGDGSRKCRRPSCSSCRDRSSYITGQAIVVDGGNDRLTRRRCLPARVD